MIKVTVKFVIIIEKIQLYYINHYRYEKK